MKNVKHIFYYIALTLCFIASSSSHANTNYNENLKAYINNSLDQINEPLLFKNHLKDFYLDGQYEPVWFNHRGKELANISKIEKIIKKQSYINGLEFSDYDFENNLNIENPYEREVMMTNTIMHYMNDVQMGRIDPSNYDRMIFTLQTQRPLAIQMAKFMDVWNKEKYLEKLTPQQVEYKKLREKLAMYRDIERKGGWPVVNLNKRITIRPGESNPSISNVRRRLDVAYHEYDGQLPDGIWIDKALLSKEAFQDNVYHKSIHQDKKDIKLKEQNLDFFYDQKLAKRVLS